MGTANTTLLIPDSIVGDASVGGWECSASLMNAQGFADYSRRAEVFYMPEGGGIWQDNWLRGLRGFILPKSITFDRGQSRTEVSLATSHVFLENAGLQGIFFASVAVPDPDNPHQSTQWTLGKIIKHIIEEHTNVADWVDTSGIVTAPADTTSVNYYTVHESDSIWETVRRIGDNEFYVPYFTKDDNLIYEVHPMFAAALPEPIMELDNTYIIGQPRVMYRDDVRPDQVQLYALTDDGDTLESRYPENIGTEGRRHKVSNIRCNSQSRLDQLAAQLYLYLQRQYEVIVTLPGPWGLMMELYDRIELTYSGTATNGVGFVWDQKKFWIDRIEVRRLYTFGAITELRLQEENFTEGYFYTDYT